MRMMQRLSFLIFVIPLQLGRCWAPRHAGASSTEILFIGNSLVRGIKRPRKHLRPSGARAHRQRPAIEDLAYHAGPARRRLSRQD
jgi:hypothetical protein